jgi:hypothetical protein
MLVGENHWKSVNVTNQSFTLVLNLTHRSCQQGSYVFMQEKDVLFVVCVMVYINNMQLMNISKLHSKWVNRWLCVKENCKVLRDLNISICMRVRAKVKSCH